MVRAKACVWFVLALGLAVALHEDGAPASAPAPAFDCTTTLVNNLINCLSFVQEGSNDTKPSKECCSGVKTVVKDKEQVSCLCNFYEHGIGDIGINISMSRALALPSSCGVSTSSISKCGNITFGAPVAAPAPASAPAPVVALGVPASAPAPARALGAPASAPAPAFDCSSTLLSNLFDCLSFVEEWSNDTKPSKECCSGVKRVAKDKEQVSCLCNLYEHGTGDIPINISMSRALALPSSCGVSTFSFSKCGNLTFSAPAAAPAAPPSAGGSNPASAVPSSTTGTSDSDKNWIPSPAHFAGLAFCSVLFLLALV